MASGEKPRYSSSLDCARQLYREGGIRNVYKGTVATFWRGKWACGLLWAKKLKNWKVRKHVQYNNRFHVFIRYPCNWSFLCYVRIHTGKPNSYWKKVVTHIVTGFFSFLPFFPSSLLFFQGQPTNSMGWELKKVFEDSSKLHGHTNEHVQFE